MAFPKAGSLRPVPLLTLEPARSLRGSLGSVGC